MKRVRAFAKEKYGSKHFEQFLDIFAEREGLSEALEQPERAQTTQQPGRKDKVGRFVDRLAKCIQVSETDRVRGCSGRTSCGK